MVNEPDTAAPSGDAAADARFRAEAARFRLVFRCDDCAWWREAAGAGDGACLLGHDPSWLRDTARPVVHDGRWIFCKDWLYAQ